MVPQWILDSLFLDNVVIDNCNLYTLSWNKGLIFTWSTSWRYQHRPSSLRSIDESPKPRMNMIMKKYLFVYIISLAWAEAVPYISLTSTATAFTLFNVIFYDFFSFTRKPMRAHWNMKDLGDRDKLSKPKSPLVKFHFFFSMAGFHK